MTEPNEDLLTLDSALNPDERDIEAPDADAVEQATPANPADLPQEVRVPFEANEYDAIEQARIVDLDDEYR
jgi:hypothetical protein